MSLDIICDGTVYLNFWQPDLIGRLTNQNTESQRTGCKKCGYSKFYYQNLTCGPIWKKAYDPARCTS